MTKSTKNANTVLVRIVSAGGSSPAINNPFAQVLKGLEVTTKGEVTTKREGPSFLDKEVAEAAFFDGRLGAPIPFKEEVRTSKEAKRTPSPKKGEGFAALKAGGGSFIPPKGTPQVGRKERVKATKAAREALLAEEARKAREAKEAQEALLAEEALVTQAAKEKARVDALEEAILTLLAAAKEAGHLVEVLDLAGVDMTEVPTEGTLSILEEAAEVVAFEKEEVLAAQAAKEAALLALLIKEEARLEAMEFAL